MGTVFVDNIKHQSAQGSGTITIGASGETVAVASGSSLDVSGNASIGTTSAGVLTINGGASTSPQLIFNDAGTNRARIGVPTGQTYLSLSGSNTLTADMAIDANGIVLVGKTATGVSSVGTELRNGVTNYCLVGTSSNEATLLLNRTSSTGNIAKFRYNNTGVGDITVTASATSYNTSSDYRLKENINYDFDATTRLKQLKPARFNFISDANTTVDGFIAHEVSSIVPEAINGEKDAVDAEGNPEYQGIDQSKLVPILTKALQEAMERIETLEAKVTALENA